MTFNRHCLIKNNISIPKKVINLYISYTLTSWLRNLSSYFKLGDCLFWSVKLTKNSDTNKYKYRGYSGCSIGFNLRSEFALPDWNMRRNVIVFGVDMSSSVHADNKKRCLHSWWRTNTRVRWYYINNRSKIYY